MKRVPRGDDATELQRSQERFRSLVETARDIVLVVTADGRIELAGPQVSALGYEPAELVGQTMDALLPDRLRTAYEDHRTRIAATPTRPTGVPLDLHARHKDGSEMPVEISLGLGSDGAMTVILADVTQRRDLERHLRQAQKLETVGQLAAGVAHDFNNLLTVITGYGAVAREEIGDGGPGARDLDEILHAAGRAAQLTGQLLAFSRQQVFRPLRLDLGVVAHELMPMLTRLIGEDIRVVLLAGDDLPSIVADRGQLEQVIVNLAVNARDAMPTGGVLTIEVQERSLGEDRAQQQPGLAAGRYVCLTVSDTGGGIAEDTAAHLFEPFFTTKAVGRGTGLGLATVHDIVIQSGGDVEVHSELGLGAAFTVYLPVAEGASETRSEPAAAPTLAPPVDGDETILVCEDEPAVQKLVARVLRRHGYTVVAASGSQEALRLAAEHLPAGIDLVVSDVVMPGMSGTELVERLSAQHAGMRTLFISGYNAKTVRSRGRLPIGSAYLQKPFHTADLVREVRRLLDTTGAGRHSGGNVCAITAPGAVPLPGP